MSTETEMPPATLEALRGSIAKWERVVAQETRDLGTDNCPLCLLFHADHFSEDDWSDGRECCLGCPVFEATGRKGCRGTPYDDYSDTGKTEHALAEVGFLKSLLPTQEPK